MNMKKSIAGVMAGAMAVSAMAASVSAVADQDSITLTYDLKEYSISDTPATATVAQVYSSNSGNAYKLAAANATALANTGKTTITFGTNGGWMAKSGKSIELFLYANATDAAAKAATQTWSYDIETADTSLNVVDGKKFNVPVTLGTATGTVDLSTFDDGVLGATAATNTYSFNSISVKMEYYVETWATDLKSLNNADFALGQMATTEIVDASGTIATPVTFEATSTKAGAWSQIDWVKPMQSQLKNPADVVEALYDMKDGKSYYTNPVAVLNDAIANGSNVTFTFTSYNGDVYESAWIAGTPSRADKAVRYETKNYVSGYYTFYGSDFDRTDNKIWSNSAFDQHLYGSGTYGSYGFADNGQGSYDYFGSYSSAWGYNLFEGAIVVNSGITMQLNQADKFIWDNNTLTFDWDTITADGKVTSAKQLLSSMLLYTSTDWYWDTLEVTVEKDAEDNASAESPITEDDDVIDDEDVADDDEIVADEETVETEATTAAVVEVPSTPNTGNASVALAVIPVALAAAAVVAKKRG